MRETQMELPRYECHKKVHALKIASVKINEDGSATIVPAYSGHARLTTPKCWAERFHGDKDDPGYFVVYADGYTSWSPTKAFEDGYTRIKP